jgi:hypothetical protein
VGALPLEYRLLLGFALAKQATKMVVVLIVRTFFSLVFNSPRFYSC